MKLKSTKLIHYKLSINQDKALINLRKIGYNKSKIINLALDDYLYKNYRKFINEEKIKLPF